jgi:hypothetical protein
VTGNIFRRRPPKTYREPGDAAMEIEAEIKKGKKKKKRKTRVCGDCYRLEDGLKR